MAPPSSFRLLLRNVKERLTGVPGINELVARGLVIGPGAHFESGVKIDAGFPWLVHIGRDCTFAPNSVVLAHDASTKHLTGYTRASPVYIGDRVFVGAGAIILPGVTIANDCIIGAGAVVRRDVPEGSIVIGNPAQVVDSVADYKRKHDKKLEEFLKTVPDEGALQYKRFHESNGREIKKLFTQGEQGYVE